MPFYIVKLVQAVDADGRPVAAEGATSVMKDLNIWDQRSIAEMAAAYKDAGVLQTNRVGPQHSAGRPFEWRGDLAVFLPFLASIEAGTKANAKQPRGPVDAIQRGPAAADEEQS